MRSRFLPYATTPGRLLAQLISDITVAVWTTLWMLVGLAVHDAISIIGEAGRQIEIGSHGIAGNLAAAGQDAQRIPVVGDALSNPITAASQAALDIAGAPHLGAHCTWGSALIVWQQAKPARTRTLPPSSTNRPTPQ